MTLRHVGSWEINTKMFRVVNGQSDLRSISRLCLAARTPAVCICDGRLVSGRTIWLDDTSTKPTSRSQPLLPLSNRTRYYPFAIWSEISSAIQGFKDYSTTRVVLDEGLGLELSTFGRLLKMRPGVCDEHEIVHRLANNLWFWQTDFVRDERGSLVRRNSISTEEDLRALALRTKPHSNPWFYLSPRLYTLGQDAFDNAPEVVEEIPHYLKRILDAKEEACASMLQLT